MKQNRNVKILMTIIFLLLDASIAQAQKALRELIPTIKKEIKETYTEQYIRTDGNINYSFFTETRTKDSLKSSFLKLLKSTADAEMEHSTEADHYLINKDGIRTETFTLRNDSLGMKAQLNLGTDVYFLFNQSFPSAISKVNISVELDKYLNENYEQYQTGKDIQTNFIEYVSPNGNSIFTPVLQTKYTIPSNIAAKVDAELRRWLSNNAFSTDYSKISLRKNIQINYTLGQKANVYYFMPQVDGSMDITKLSAIENKEDDKSEYTLSDGEWTNVYDFPLSEEPLPEGIETVFSLERRSDVTIMHIYKRLYSDNVETWTDDSQTFLVDEETQTHFMARGCSLKDLWGKMIRIRGMEGKTVAMDVYFPPLPSGIRVFSVWGLRRFGVPSEHLFFMKRDGDLYFER